jgi:SIR2-like domain
MVLPVHWNMILRALHERRCVPFLGAGVNASTADYQGLPLGGEVASRLLEVLLGTSDLKQLANVVPGPLAEEYGDLVQLRVSDLARVALHVQFTGDDTYLASLLREILPDGDRDPSRVLRTLARLPLDLIVTTNYDRLMERALEQAGRPAPLVVGAPRDSLQRQALQRKLLDHDGLVLYKIHGSFQDPGRGGETLPMVVSEEDYIDFLAASSIRNQTVPRLIEQRLVDGMLLFLGYGLEDWDIRTIYKGYIEQLPPSLQRKSFAIQKNPSRFWTEFWKSKNVVIYDMDLYEFIEELEARYAAWPS